MRRINYKRVFILIVLAAVVTFLSISFLAATYAYYSNLPRVYTSDDSSGEIARVGMRINLLFDRLDPDQVGGVSLTYPDGTEEGMTVAYDSTAQWGTAANPYIISKPRHMMNLYALQKSGYFYEKYISNNFTNGDYNGGTSMPYFRVCEVDGKPAAVNGVKSDGSNVKINPIGTDEYPFIGRIAGAFADGTATLNGKTSTSSILANFLVEVTDETDVGLFGKIDYLGDSSSTQTDAQGNVTFAGTISSVTDLLLYDIKIVSHQSTFIERLANHMFADGIPNKNIEYDEDHHVGILAGHIEYSEITNISVYYSSNDIIAIDVDQEGANYYSDSGIIGFVYNLNPEVKGSSVGTNTGTTLAGTVDGGGDEWGGSIDMMTLHTRLQNVLSRVRRTQATYTSSETLTITMKIENGVEVEDTRVTSNQVTSVIPNYTATDSTRYPKVYVADDPANGSFSYGDYNAYTSNTTTGNTAQYDLFHGKNTDYSPLTLTTYIIHANKEAGYLISSGTNYLNAAINNNNVTSITNGNTSASATVWEIDGSGYINARLESSTSIDKYYLKSTNGLLSLVTSTSQATAFTRTNTGTNTSELTYTTTNAGLTITWYLVYDSGWKCVPYSTSYTFTNGTYYLNVANDALSATTTSTTQWGVTNGYIYTAVDGILYFLYYNTSSKTFELSTTNKTQFDISNNQMKFTSSGTTWYVVYNPSTSNWDIVKDLNPIVIYTGTNYLCANEDGIFNGTSATATRWTFNGTSGTISTVINGKEYYLYGTTSLSLSATNSTTWTFNNNQFYYSYSGNTYYLSYVDSNWTVAKSASDLAGTYIKIGGQYLKANSTSSFSFVDDMSSATKWTQNDNYYQTTLNGSTYYLYCNTSYYSSASLSLNTSNAQAFQYNNGTLRYYDGWDYYYILNNDGVPSVSTSTQNTTVTTYYLKDTNNNYYINASDTTVTASTTPATKWIRDGNYYYTIINGNNYYLYLYRSNRGQYSVRLTTSTSNTGRRFILDGSNRLYATNNQTRYISGISGTTWQLDDTASNGHVFELEEAGTYTQSTSAEIVTVTAGSVNQTIYKDTRTIDTTMNNSTSTKTTSNTLTSSEREVKEKTVTTEKGGYDTYFPLIAEETSPFEVNPKNTGYIVGGTHTDYQKVSGDVRVSSYYTINYLSRSLGQNTDKSNNTSYSDAKLEVLTRTYQSNGFKRVTDEYNYNHSSVTTKLSNYSAMTVEALGLVKYNSARAQLADVFAEDDSRVYGMHFMDAPISINELIVAPKVVVNGNTYYDYQMPESSIDFKLKAKGYINFFAGTYYANTGKENNSFFSLHEIKRNSVTQEITSIKHIEKIYGNPSKDTLPYIYKYYNEAEPTLPEGKGYVEMFNASWIENPGNGSDIEWYTMYYFEIPVNAGEYALGSVDGKYGAYLCYLDIGASAASHQAILGSIDFVYDNGGSKIVTVKDVSDTETTNSYYIPSLVVIYTRNTDKVDGNFVKINNFTIKTRRTRGSEEAKGTVTTTIAGTSNAYLHVVATSKGGDEITTSGGYVPS